MTMTNEIFAAAERTFHASGSKPKDLVAVLNQLASDFQVEASVEGGMLTMRQGGVIASTGTIIAAHKAKFPRSYYGETGAVNFKDDLAGDTEAKMRYIRDNGFDSWNRMPLNEKSAGAQHVVTDAIPSAFMKRSEYLRLSLAEKSKLAGEVGAKGIDKILSRK
jgi:hypothetical protein